MEWTIRPRNAQPLVAATLDPETERPRIAGPLWQLRSLLERRLKSRLGLSGSRAAWQPAWEPLVLQRPEPAVEERERPT